MRSTTTMCVVLMGLLVAGSARAHEDPPGCFESVSPFIALSVLRSDGVTPLVGNVSECENLFFRARISKGQDSDTICAFSQGSFTLTTPDGISHVISDSLPCVGGTTSLEGCDATRDFVESALIPYQVSVADAVEGLLASGSSYQGGVLHDSAPNTPGVGTSTVRSIAMVRCDDNNPCTTDICNPSLHGAAACSNTPIVCTDNDLCTSDQCNPATGQCEFTPTVICNDNDACTTDQCNTQTGSCVFTPSVVCNDNNACTIDACVPATGTCSFIDVVTPSCNDENACTQEACNTSTGQCETLDVTVCNDDNPCSVDTCNTATGLCEFTPVGPGFVCRSSAGVCDVAETCAGTVCPTDGFRDGSTVCRSAVGVCDQAESCTGSSAACPADARRPDGTPCSDGLFCNGTDTCAGGECSQHAGSPCPGPDGDADCAESCSEATRGCTAPDPDGASCSDADKCTTSDVCASGACRSGPAIECPPAQVCNASTGLCGPSTECPASCDDGNPCTTDACDRSLGQCGSVPVTDGTSCDDDDDCTSGGNQCAAGTCGQRDCDTDAHQVLENGVPQPVVLVDCTLYLKKRNGKVKGGTCSAKLVDATGQGLGVALAVHAKKPTVLSKLKMARFKQGKATLKLVLNTRGKEQLGALSPDARLMGEVQGSIKTSGTKARKIRTSVSLRR